MLLCLASGQRVTPDEADTGSKTPSGETCNDRWIAETNRRTSYLSWKAKQNGFDARFIELAGQVNGHMPHYVVAKITDALNTRRKAINGARILALGVAYKRDVDDVRESPALDVMRTLQEKGAEVAYSDPHVPVLAAHVWGGPHALESVPLDAKTLEQFDCAVILTDHRAFDYELIVAHSDRLVDTRNALGRRSRSTIVRLGAPLRAHDRLPENDKEDNQRRSEAEKIPRPLRRKTPRPGVPLSARSRSRGEVHRRRARCGA